MPRSALIRPFSVLALCILFALSFASCSDNPTSSQSLDGLFAIEFSNHVGAELMGLEVEGSTNFMYTTNSGQTFNLSRFGYYVSEIRVEGPNGEAYTDRINVSANAAEVQGFYQIKESDPSTKLIILKNVPAGSYNKISFTLGIRENIVQEGAAGGILDPAAGAWFWNWNAGYISMIIEGTAPNSPQLGNTFKLHVGGWKDVPIEQTDGTQRFVNNIKTITLNFGTAVTVNELSTPTAHIIVDVLEILNGIDINFGLTNAVHSPKAGQPIADQITSSFTLDHIHQ